MSRPMMATKASVSMQASRSHFMGGRAALPVVHAPARYTNRSRLVVKAAADDEDFENRIAKLKEASGRKVAGKGVKAEKRIAKKEGAAYLSEQSTAKKNYDFSNEVVFYEGTPSAGDLALNVALGFTLVWLPLTLAAVARKVWFEFKITDKRVTVINTSPVAGEAGQIDVAYPEIASVVTVGRFVGLWGDLVITLKDGNKVELRSLENFLEARKYIEARMEECKKPSSASASSGFA